MCIGAFATWQNLPYANLPQLIERASFVGCNILWHKVGLVAVRRNDPNPLYTISFSFSPAEGAYDSPKILLMKQQENNLIYSTESEYKFVFNIILIATPILSSFIVGLFLRILFAFISFKWKIPSRKCFINQQSLKFPQIAFLLKFFCNLWVVNFIFFLYRACVLSLNKRVTLWNSR